jgi:hypothetical protein
MEKRLRIRNFLRCLFAGVLLWVTCNAQLHAQVLEKTKISASFRQEPVSLRLKKIQEKTGLTIAFEEKDVLQKTAAAGSFENASLLKVLQQSLKGLSLGYKEVNGVVVVFFQGTGIATEPKKGTVSGVVVDEENGEAVTGATVTIGTQNSITDVDGSFTFQLPEGNYEATITSIGYGTKNVTDILVKDNNLFTVNLTLKRQKGNLQGVVVSSSARRETVAALYVRQKNNAAITDGISAEQIARTPDKNIGESLKRISGLSALDNKYVVVRGLSERYNQAMLNGQAMPSTELNRKQFSFDIIPANMVDNITVAKTITPDVSAEFGGGLIQINTKDVPSENFLSLSAGTTVNDLTAGSKMLSLKRDGSREYLGQYARHRYLYGEKSWQSLADIRTYKNAKGDNAVLTNNWQPYYYDALPSQNYQVSLGRVMALDAAKRSKLGVIASVSYRNTQSVQEIMTSRFGFGEANDEKNMLNGWQYGFNTTLGGVLGVGYTTAKHKISWQNVVTQQLEQQTNYGSGYHTVLADNSRAMIEKILQTALWQSQLKGEHALGHKGIKLGWTGNYILVKRDRPDNHILIWRTAPGDFNLKHNDFTVEGVSPEGLSNHVLRMYSYAQEKNWSWDANVQVPFNFKITKNIFKAGYAGWNKDRRFYVAMVGDKPSNSTLNPPLSVYFTPEYGGGTNIVSDYGDDFNRDAQLHALYGMFDNRIGNKLRLVWGVRAEYFDMNRTNQTLDQIINEINKTRNPTDQLDFSALYSREKNWKLFPSANITYSLTPRINIRAAYAKSIIRPDLREMAGFQEYDFELGGLYSAANLIRSTNLHHYDLRAEWYPGAGEVVSASFFYKDIQYPMEIMKQASVNIYQLRNNYKSHNYGVEAEVRKTLAFTNIPVVKNLTVYGNFTALTGRVTPMQEDINIVTGNVVTPKITEGKEEKRPLMGQSNYMGNAGLYYDDKHLHISLSYNSISNRMVVYEQDAITSQYERPIRSFDGQIAWRFLNQRAEIKLNISNLLNESVLVYYNGSKTPEEHAEAAKGNYSTKFLLYDKDTDLLVQRQTPGRTYGLTISYLFK